ncbi:hypothetical protein ACHHYP_07706 [Achlya hypogyna]|uniref:Uncharacterized protein n=1 Tax=Achlya hypogyna TaxID=1202772 RepID=A0A1V9YQI8_ACHHY|nr:hypothetical protein ACHHYP_07706 [Achlya hypogyna]
MQVVPAGPKAARSSLSHRDRVTSVAGLVWMWLSLGTSLWYLDVYRPSAANDFGWPYYNASGYQSFLVDTVNHLLTLRALGVIDLSSVATERSYSSPLIAPSVHPTYASAMATASRTTLTSAISSLRNTSAADAYWLPTQYCWVDFDQRWQLAHTTKRQQRCQVDMVTNAAVYLEAVLRNVPWDDFIYLFGDEFAVAFESELQASAAGVSWLASTSAPNTTVATEASLWQSHGLKIFWLQWQNNVLTGVTETLLIESALGVVQTMVLKGIANTYGPWTSVVFNGLLVVEMDFAVDCNASLIRNAVTTVYNSTCDFSKNLGVESYAYVADVDGAFRGQAGVVRDAVGPFLSVDMWVVTPPVDLIQAVHALKSQLHAYLATSSDAIDSYMQLRAFDMAPMPPRWVGDYVYYGGNPMCLHGDAKPYAQSPFSFHDSCSDQAPFTLAVSRAAMVTALVMTSFDVSTETICGIQRSAACSSTLARARRAADSIVHNTSLVTEATNSVLALNVTLIQMVSNPSKTNWAVLTQPVLEPSSWAFYGWIMLLDWAAGVREVVSFQGDNGTLVLISDMYNTASATPYSNELSRASAVIYYLTVYTTAVLGAVTVLCTVMALAHRLHFDGDNLFFFDRVAGSTWLGRPLMFLRGGTAVLLLSTAPIELRQSQGVLTHLVLPRRAVIETMLLAFEATWVGCALHEVLVPLVTHRGARVAGITGTMLIWCVSVGMDIAAPVTVAMTLDPQCTTKGMVYRINCRSGVIQVGSYKRAIFLLLLSCIVVPLTVAIGSKFSREHSKVLTANDLVVSGVGQALLRRRRGLLDAVACILIGVVPLRNLQALDWKLWAIVSDGVSAFPTSNMLTKVWPVIPASLTSTSRWLPWHLALVGTVYIGAAISGSISYLEVSRNTLSNDLIWPTYNLTGAHVFLADWFTSHMPLRTMQPTLALDAIEVNSPDSFDAATGTLKFPGRSGAKAQYTTLTTLTGAIGGLRNLDACDAPWVFTQYCYLDFDRRWPMANSVRRQQRCAAMIANGAVFLESLLRNVHWDDFQRCWGNAFDIGFVSELQHTVDGRLFLATLGVTWLSVPNEAAHWASFNVTEYALQWQNYKAIGIVSTYSVVNAYGAAYPFTLASTSGHFRFESQTSFKMYWGLANDLLYVDDNTTAMGGRSLLRTSATFAFANASLQEVLMQTNTLPSAPWDSAIAALAAHLGPFGSIDMVYMHVPAVVLQAVSAIRDAMLRRRRSAPDAYSAIPIDLYDYVVPSVWAEANFVSSGGSILCPPRASALDSLVSHGILSPFSFHGECNEGTVAFLNVREDHILFASIAANLSNANTTDLCAQMSYWNCSEVVDTVGAFWGIEALPLSNTWSAQLQAALAPLAIELLQFGKPNESAPVKLYRRQLLDSTTNAFDYISWLMVYDWVLGYREVVAFQGDAESFVLMGDGAFATKQPVDSAQLPTVFALYAQRAVQYVTLVMIGLASTTAIYILLSRGRIEGLNMLELSRVGGIVWVGRPLVVLRSLTAICLLSTASLRLLRDGDLSRFAAARVPWYETCLAANEVTWLVGIVNDFAIVVTQERTLQYATVNSVLVWAITACITMLAPVEATVAVAPVCAIETLDFQVVCSAGTVFIGSRQRLVSLVGLVLGCNGVCFGVTRYLWKERSRIRSSSLLLSGGAKYLFEQGGWYLGSVYYMDRASAVLNGLLSVRLRDQWAVFDVKTWRLHVLPKRSTIDGLEQALPLVDD